MTTITSMQEQKLLEFSEGLLWSVRQEPYSEKAFTDICKILYLKISQPDLLDYNFFEDAKEWTFAKRDVLFGKHISFGISRSSFEAILSVLETYHWNQLSIQERGFFFETFMNSFLIKEGKRYKKDLAIAPVVVDYIIDILAPKKDDLILNPDCGAGDFLVKVKQCINATRVLARDVDIAVCQLARFNLWIHGVNYKITERSIDDDFDENDENKVDIILGISIYDIKSSCNFLKYCLYFLKPGGKMGIVLTEDFLISNSNESQSIRSYIKDKARILKITALPQNAFYNTTLKTSVLFFQKFTEERTYYFEENQREGDSNNYKILYADIKSIGIPSPIPYFKSKDNQLLLLSQEYKNYKPNAPDKNETLLEETAYEMLVNWSVSSLKNQIPKTNDKYPQRKLYELIDKNNSFITIDESTEYKRVTVRSSDKGVELRDIVLGKDIKRKRQFLIKAGQFIVAKINPTSGAIGIVPSDLDNAITTDEFSTYTVKKEIVLPEYLVLLFSSPSFTNYLNTLTTGTVMLRLRETLFLKMDIPLPTLQEQIELCQKIMALKPEIKRLQENLIEEKKIFENKIFKS